MADYLNFGELVEETERLLGHFQSSVIELVKTTINMVYWEILNCDQARPLHWLLKNIDDVKAVDPTVITDITSVTPPVVTAVAHGLVTGDIVSIYSVSGMTEVNNRTFHFTRVTDDTGSLQNLDKVSIVGAGYTAYTSGGSLVHRGKTLSSNALRLVTAGFFNYEPMTKLDFKKAEEDTRWWGEAYSRPIKCTHRKSQVTSDGSELDQVIWYPGCDDNYDCRFLIESKPDRLEADADIVRVITPFQHSIIAGVGARLVEFDVQVENAIVWPKIYEWHINEIRSHNRRWWKSHEGKGSDNKPYLL